MRKKPTQDLSTLSPEQRVQRAYNDAIRLLGRRDHSVFELSRKLTIREHTDEAIQSALEELQQLNYVNDARYAKLYTEQRLERGYGPLSVRARLRQRGIASTLVNEALAAQNANWAELAQIALENRFDEQTINSLEQRDVARISRFLSTRGFQTGDALRALTLSRKQSRGRSS
ncbi:MAG: regulatory protein RecX [Granulosicoccus sp.]